MLAVAKLVTLLVRPKVAYGPMTCGGEVSLHVSPRIIPRLTATQHAKPNSQVPFTGPARFTQMK